MKTQYYTAATLDGFIAGPNHALDWLLQFSDPPTDDYAEFIANVGAIAMGSSTYEWVRNYVLPEGGEPQPWPYDGLPTWVFSSRDQVPVPGADLRFVRGDVRPFHAEMAEVAQGKNLWIVGGGDLVGQFYDHGLLDELIVTIASVTLGAGKPLLPRRIATPPLRLKSARAFGTDLCGSSTKSRSRRQRDRARPFPETRRRNTRAGLGALAYFLLIGQAPFAGRSLMKVLVAHLHEEPEPIAALGSDVPADLEAVLMRCLAKKPEHRFADIAQLDAALEACGAAGAWAERESTTWWAAHS